MGLAGVAGRAGGVQGCGRDSGAAPSASRPSAGADPPEKRLTLRIRADSVGRTWGERAEYSVIHAGNWQVARDTQSRTTPCTVADRVLGESAAVERSARWAMGAGRGVAPAPSRQSPPQPSSDHRISTSPVLNFSHNRDSGSVWASTLGRCLAASGTSLTPSPTRDRVEVYGRLLGASRGQQTQTAIMGFGGWGPDSGQPLGLRRREYSLATERL